MVVHVRRVGIVLVPIPQYAKPGDAGLDLPYAATEAILLPAGCQTLLPTGLSFAIPEGFEGQVRPRSGQTMRGRLAAIGTIDSGYRGEVMVLVQNVTNVPIRIEPLERIAQLVISPVLQAELVEVAELDQTDRGTSGFGSTGAGP